LRAVISVLDRVGAKWCSMRLDGRTKNVAVLSLLMASPRGFNHWLRRESGDVLGL